MYQVYQIRHAVDTDYEAIAAIATLIKPEPYSAKEMLEEDRRFAADPANTSHRLVGVGGDGRVVGYGAAFRADWEPEGRWDVSAYSHPAERGHGVGRALLNAAERIAREGGATELNAWVLGADDQSFAWIQRRGFTPVRQRTESVLDLSDWDPSPFAGSVERVSAAGLRLVSYEGTDLPKQVLRSVYELDRITSPDVPMWDSGDNFPSYEQYRKDFLNDPSPRTYTLALDDDRVVGMSGLWYSEVPGKSAQIGYTATLREYRGRGIAMALKLLGIEAALRHGAPRIRTHNDPDNPPMLAINFKLGFKFIPGPWILKKHV